MSETMRIWDALSKTDPAHTKGFKRAGGFSGTAVKPMWVIKRLTVAIGETERLTDLTPDQLDRLRQAVIRLSNAERKHGRG